MSVRSQLERSRTLVTPFGRKRIFFNRWSDSTLKEGLAYIPQSTVADIVNQALITLHNSWGEKKDRHLLLQVHDSILVQAKEDVLEEVIQEIKKALTVPVEINGRFMVIPSDFKIGLNWGDGLKKYEKVVVG
jgi:DNA polymerase-1